MTQPRWFTEFDPGHSGWYVDRFRRMAAEGADVVGEARLVDAVVAPRSRILDAGCGPGRIGAELFRRGHTVVGVDVDATLIAAADEDHPGPMWICADLSDLELPALGVASGFDAAVLAGNVLPYVAPATETAVLRHVAEHVRPDGAVVVGFGLGLGYSLVDFDADCTAAGLVLEHRFATWDLRRWTEASDWAVTILRRPAE